VYDALQDREGFMWFATENGLSRFDGKDFKTFTTKDGLPDNEILKLFLDSKGRVWIMPFRPSLCYYYKGKIYNKNNDSVLSKVSLSAHAYDMAEDKSGNLVVVEQSAWHIILKSGIVKRNNNKINDLPIEVSAVGVNKLGQAQLLVIVFPKGGRKYGLFRIFYPLEQKFETIQEQPNWPEISRCLVTPEYTIFSSRTYSRVFFYKDSSVVLSTKIPFNTLSISYIDKRKIAFNTATGIVFFDPQTKTLSDPILKDFSISSAFQDKENNLWLTTTVAGVLMIPSFQFRNYSFLEKNKASEISALFIIGDTVYAGSWGKAWKVNSNSLTSSCVLAGSPNAKVISIVPVDNKLYFAKSIFNQNAFNPEMNQDVYGLSIKSATVGKSGLLLAAHRAAVLFKRSGESEDIWRGRTTCAIEKDSGFYIGTLNGLFFKSYDGKIATLDKISPVFASRIVNLAIAPDNVLWVTTKGNGIAAFDNNKLLHHFTEADGLTSDNCNSVYLDSNIVWLGTEKGLNRIELSRVERKITPFSMSDGLPSNVINAVSAKGNKVFVGTPAGLTYFEVDKISQTSASDLQLTGIYIANKYWTYDSTNFSLPHKNNDIRFEFSGISFKSAGEMTYKYRLLGLQPEWRTTTEKQLSFPSLSSGRYTFQLKVVNKYGVESRLKEVSFVIEKLFWQKAWFKIITALFLATVVWALFVYRIRRVREKEKEKSQLNQHIAELEQKALRAQMNPHFIFNCLNSIQQYVAERDITGANYFITDFSRLIRMTLDLSAHVLITMADEIEYITTYLKVEKARLEGQFDYCVDIDESLDLHRVYLPPLLLQPYVENSLRHGIKYKTQAEGLIRIAVRKKEAGVLVSITDNGIGRDAARKYKSKFHIQYQSRGMAINEARIKILNDSAERKIELQVTDLYDPNNEAKGTRVDIFLP
jgi:ligand-binding sensor domain-containing protein